MLYFKREYFYRNEMERINDDLSSLATPMDTLLLDPANARTGHDIDAICASLTKFGQRTPIVVNKNTNIILKGNGTYKAAKQLGWDKIAASYVNDDNLTATQYSIADNRTGDLSVFDDVILKDLLNAMDEPLDVPGIDEKFLNELNCDFDEQTENNNETPEQPHSTLVDRFIIPPFSILDARQGYWQERKRAWIAIGIQSELGRGETNNINASQIGEV